MKEEIKHIVVGAVGAMAQAGGLHIPESVLIDMKVADNWHFVDSKGMIINNAATWCYEFKAPDETDEQHFLQVEISTEFKTVTAINVITNEEERITAYTK